MTEVVPPRVPPVPDWIETVTRSVMPLMTLPSESRKLTTGAVVIAAPEAPGTGAVESASCEGIGITLTVIVPSSLEFCAPSLTRKRKKSVPVKPAFGV